MKTILIIVGIPLLLILSLIIYVWVLRRRSKRIDRFVAKAVNAKSGESSQLKVRTDKVGKDVHGRLRAYRKQGVWSGYVESTRTVFWRKET